MGSNLFQETPVPLFGNNLEFLGAICYNHQYSAYIEWIGKGGKAGAGNVHRSVLREFSVIRRGDTDEKKRKEESGGKKFA